jgi:hypothetical protein
MSQVTHPKVIVLIWNMKYQCYELILTPNTSSKFGYLLARLVKAIKRGRVHHSQFAHTKWLSGYIATYYWRNIKHTHKKVRRQNFCMLHGTNCVHFAGLCLISFQLSGHARSLILHTTWTYYLLVYKLI